MKEGLSTAVLIVGGGSAVGTLLLLLAVVLSAAYGALGGTGVFLVLGKLESVGLAWAVCAVTVLGCLGQVMAVVTVNVSGVTGVAAGGMAAAAGATVAALAVAVGAGMAARRGREFVDRVVAAFTSTVTKRTFLRIMSQLELSTAEMILITIAIAPLLEAAVVAFPATIGLAAMVLLTWLNRGNRRERKEREDIREEWDDDDNDEEDDDHY